MDEALVLRVVQAIQAERTAGETTVVVQPWPRNDTPTGRADAFVASLGLNALGAGWRVVDRSRADRLLFNVLHKDLAYGSVIMPAARADELARAWLDLFPPQALFFTNGTFHNGSSGASWSPITHATFDTGVLVVAPDTLGLCWVQDED